MASCLAAELAEEEAWDEGWLEVRRADRDAPGTPGPGTPPPDAAVLAVPRLAWNAGERSRAIEEWQRLADTPESSGSASIRERATLDWGTALAADGNDAGAFPLFRRVFLETSDPVRFREAATALDVLLRRNRDLSRGNPALCAQIRLFRNALPVSARRLAAKRLSPPPSPGIVSRAVRWPGQALIWLYRTQISPAIGSRCSLTPSCSVYFMEATRAHGLLGVPLGADRLIREPDVLRRDYPWVLIPAGYYRIADPVSDHDYWFDSKVRQP